MMQMNILDHILGSHCSLAVLRVLLSESQGLTGRQIAKLAHLSAQGGQDALAKLETFGIVKWTPAGRAQLYQLNSENELLKKVLVPLFDSERKYIKILTDKITSALNSKILSTTLFGSFARGDSIPGSDFDILVLVQDKKEAKKIRIGLALCAQEVSRLFHLQLSPIVMIQKEAQEKAKQNHPLIESILKEGVLLQGVPLAHLIYEN